MNILIQNKKTIPKFIAVILVFMLGLTINSLSTKAVNTKQAEDLFLQEYNQPGTNTFADEITKRPTISKYKKVKKNPNINLLTQKTIKLNFFDEKVHTFVNKKIEKRNESSYTWIGKGISSDDQAIIVVNGENVTGYILIGSDSYSIYPTGSGMQILGKVDQTKFLEEDNEELMIDNRSNISSSPTIQSTTADSSSYYRVLVVYTPDAASSTSDIGSLIWLSAAQTNESYQNSGINTQLQIADYYMTNYNTSGNAQTDLNRVMEKSDGYMDEVHGIRDTVGADIVILLSEITDYCGLATSIFASENTAFAVVKPSCSFDAITFAHEIGHLQGAGHNPEAHPGIEPNPIFSYGHGYCYAPGDWSTVMSYTKCGGDSYVPNIPYWSNPNVTYNGVPMGDSSYYNNARVLNETAYTIANFRQGDGCNPPGAGDWYVNVSCTFTGSRTAPGNIIIRNNATLIIENGASLNVDFVNKFLKVEPGSKLTVRPNGKIH